jgi:hypothetical protein
VAQGVVRKGSAQRKGHGGLCEFHASHFCDGCGELGADRLDVVGASPKGREFRLCTPCLRKRRGAPGLVPPATPTLTPGRRQHPEYEGGFARLGMMLPAVCRIEGSTGTKTERVGKSTVTTPTPARWWEIACPTVAPYDRLAACFDEMFTRHKAPTLCSVMGNSGERSVLTGGFMQAEYGYWHVPASSLPEPHAEWWQRVERAIPRSDAGSFSYDAPALAPVEVAKPAKRSRKKAA